VVFVPSAIDHTCEFLGASYESTFLTQPFLPSLLGIDISGGTITGISTSAQAVKKRCSPSRLTTIFTCFVAS